jgi:hypothetical protein
VIGTKCLDWRKTPFVKLRVIGVLPFALSLSKGQSKGTINQTK